MPNQPSPEAIAAAEKLDWLEAYCKKNHVGKDERLRMIADHIDATLAASDRVLVSREAWEQSQDALRRCVNKLHAMGREFSSPNFTDRYGDGPAMLSLASLAEHILDKMKESHND